MFERLRGIPRKGEGWSSFVAATIQTYEAPVRVPGRRSPSRYYNHLSRGRRCKEEAWPPAREICGDGATDAEWKVKLIARRPVERHLPLSAYIPIPVLIVSLMVTFL